MDARITILIASLVFAVGCGDDSLKKTPPPGSGSNNGGTNNATTNNSTTNNATTNNATTNNATTNNATTNAVTGPCVELASNSLSFGAAQLEQTVTARLQVTNCSSDTTVAPPTATIDNPEFAYIQPAMQIQPGETVGLAFTFQPTVEAERNGTAELTWASLGRTDRIALTGRGTDDPCGEAVAQVRETDGGDFRQMLQTVVGTELEFDASSSTPGTGSIMEYDWSIVSKPTESSALLTSNTTLAPLFTPDVPGTYVVSLDFLDSNGVRACEADEITVSASASTTGITENLMIQLTWDTPADADQTDMVGSDMDLHWLHQSGTWNEGSYDCYWRNPDPDWGDAGSPVAQDDDDDGAGPEQVDHDAAGSSVRYTAGVNYYADNGLGESFATVRFYVDGVLYAEYADHYMPSTGSFWEVFSYEVPGIFTEHDMNYNGFPTP